MDDIKRNDMPQQQIDQQGIPAFLEAAVDTATDPFALADALQEALRARQSKKDAAANKA